MIEMMIEMMKKLNKLEKGQNKLEEGQNDMLNKLNKLEEGQNKLEEELEKERAKNKRKAFTEDAEIPVEINFLI